MGKKTEETQRKGFLYEETMEPYEAKTKSILIIYCGTKSQ